MEHGLDGSTEFTGARGLRENGLRVEPGLREYGVNGRTGLTEA